MSACGLMAVTADGTVVARTSLTDRNLKEERGKSTKDSRILLGKQAGTKAEPYTSNDKPAIIN